MRNSYVFRDINEHFNDNNLVPVADSVSLIRYNKFRFFELINLTKQEIRCTDRSLDKAKLNSTDGYYN